MPHVEMPLPYIPEFDDKADDGSNEFKKEHPLKPIPYEVDINTGSILKEDVYEAFEKNGAEILGEGEECLVVALPDQPGKAIAYSFNNLHENFDVRRAKTTFYTHKIMKILFPHNFPEIYAAIAEDKNKNKGTIREKVNHIPYGEKAIKHSFRDVAEFFRMVLRVSPDQYFDTNDDNFVLTPEGDEYFLDLITTSSLGSSPIADVLSAKEFQIIEYMDKHGFSQDDINKVSRYIGRMSQLSKENEKFDETK